MNEELKNEIKNTVEMERLARKYLQDFNEEYAKNKALKEFIDYVSEVCKERMTFEKPNKDTQSCLNFIDNTFNDFELRIKDLKIRGILK